MKKVAALTLLLSTSVLAQAVTQSSPAESIRPAARFTIFPKLGAAFPQVLNRLETSFTGALELGFVSPWLGNRLALTVELSYAQPAHTRTVEDPRVANGTVSYTVQEKQLGLFFGPRFYFLPLSQTLVPYLGAGARVQFIASQLDAGAGVSTFGTHVETGTHLAFGAQAGLGYRLGPGHIALEIQLLLSPIDHLITGGVNIGDLSARAGYLLHF